MPWTTKEMKIKYAVAGARRLNFPVVNKYVSAKAKEVKIKVAACVCMVALLNSNCSSSKCNNKKALKQER